MKYADVQKLYETGFITDEQRRNIIARFQLREDDGNKFLAIISILGAVLITAGIVLIISAHWNEIPRGVKIAAGILLLLGAHAGGWWLREIHGVYRKTGEALQFIGSALFLADIALVGQIYHLESRTPNAFLLWLAGLAALPWILRSKAQFVLFLAGLAVWFGCEINERDSLIYFGDEAQVLAYALLGLNFLGAGFWLRRTSFADFAPAAEKLGILGLLAFAYPLTWAGFLSWQRADAALTNWLLPALAVTGIALATAGVSKLSALTRQWQITWAGVLAVAAALLCVVFYLPRQRDFYWFGHFDAVNAFASIGLFVFCLLQIQTGLQQRSRFLVNLGIAFIGLDILSAYFGLFGTMAVTGLMFVVTGVFLILFGVYLEKKRRKFMRQIKNSNVEVVP
jgi:uncharacterized membrane protein